MMRMMMKRVIESTKFPILGRRLFVRGTIAGLFLSLAFLRLMHSSYSNTRMFTIPNIIISKIPNRTELNHTNNVSGKTMPMYLPTFDSSLSYSWVGNQWQPPSGVPLYTIQEMRHIFTQGNVLWIGDSTARQDYVTLYNMITSSSSTHDDDHYYSNLTVAQLNEGINVNKGGKITEICDRRYPLDLLLCRDIGNATVNNKIVHYDYTEQICFRDVFNYINTNWRQLVAKYSTILVSVGIWDVIRFQYCGGQNVTFVRDVLNVIDEKFSANGHVQVLWKVHCGAGNENASEMDRTAQIQQLTRDWFATHPQNNHTNNMAMIDLAKEMEGRTYGEARIAGDIPPHLGPTARMLFLQMATHEMAQQKGRSLTKNRTI